MLILLMSPFDPILLPQSPYKVVHTHTYKLDNWLFNKQKNRPYLICEWKMKTR